MRVLRHEDIFAEVLGEPVPNLRWRKFAAALARIGLDQINYGFLDISTAERMEARCDPALTTMRPDWIRHYTAERYDLSDHVLAPIRAGSYLPMAWNEAPPQGTRAFQAYEEAREAGLKSGILIPLAGPISSSVPGAAIMIGSSLSETEFGKITAQSVTELASLAHLFHAGAVGALLRRRDQAEELSPRERDILQYAALGLRVDEIAHRLGLAPVTIGFHTRNARRKLKCKSLTEAVARALLYGDLTL